MGWTSFFIFHFNFFFKLLLNFLKIKAINLFFYLKPKKEKGKIEIPFPSHSTPISCPPTIRKSNERFLQKPTAKHMELVMGLVVLFFIL